MGVELPLCLVVTLSQNFMNLFSGVKLSVRSFCFIYCYFYQGASPSFDDDIFFNCLASIISYLSYGHAFWLHSVQSENKKVRFLWLPSGPVSDHVLINREGKR